VRALGAAGSLLTALALSAPASASCFDGRRDGPESDVDCGGDCPPCEIEQACAAWRDCRTGRCAEHVCQERAWKRGDPIPIGYQVELSESDRPATARRAGVLFFGVGYAGAYVLALTKPGDRSWMLAPVAGPWLTLARGDQELKGLIVVDGVLQGVGAVLLVGGIAGAGRQLVRLEWAGAELTPAAAVRRDAGWLGLGGSF
jgi:hypothetical protein